jgi:CDP-diacylglycerol--glycerol-3-phosphate 3-phosphatidyltransferase
MTDRRFSLLLVNALTLSRVPLVLLFVIGAVVDSFNPAPTWRAAAAFISLVLSALTDLFDGVLARRLNVSTRFGALADPLTDKVFYLTSLPTLLFLIMRHDGWDTHGVVMLTFAILFLLRDQWVSFLRSIGSEYGADVRANWSGKLRTALSFPTICAVYVYVAWQPLWLPLWLVYTLETIVIALNTISIYIYSVQYMPYLKRSLK